MIYQYNDFHHEICGRKENLMIKKKTAVVMTGQNVEDLHGLNSSGGFDVDTKLRLFLL